LNFGGDKGDIFLLLIGDVLPGDNLSCDNLDGEENLLWEGLRLW